MSTYQHIGLMGLDQVTHPGIVARQTPGNVRHEDFLSLTYKHLVFGAGSSHFMPVYIAEYGHGGLEGFQLLEDIQCADISGMPDLITLAEILKDGRGQVAVGI